ncbi:MAG: aminopeptidase [Candidatus Hydrogenedentes bacterium]|nr:aminopeptidase [Candidatus Hydrogenedentota bacterium]
MRNDFEEILQRYADAAVTGALNLQKGQRLMIIGPRTSGGVPHDSAVLVRALARSAYRHGAALVEVLWGDEDLQLIRFNEAPADSFGNFSAWQCHALADHVDGGGAILSVAAGNPDLLAGLPSERVSAFQKAASTALQPVSERIGRNKTNWLVVSGAAPAWAARVFPNEAPAAQVEKLWDAIFAMCRLEGPNAGGGWHAHMGSLLGRMNFLNERRYSALKYKGPGTDLTIGLPEGHVWASGPSTSATGIRFSPNMPTEEVFTMPHCRRVEGVVQSSKPLSYGGVMIDDFTVRFSEGRVVEVKAAQGEEALRNMVASDDGAARLGEVALVPHSSPIAQSGILFYNTLFDENAASHVALGSAYRFTVKGGEAMTDEQFAAAGGNKSIIHVDFMIGSDKLDIDGVLPNGATEPLMRAGEWAISV